MPTLSTKILREVFQNIDDLYTLRCLLVVSRDTHLACEPLLYRQVTFRPHFRQREFPSHYFQRFHNSIADDPKRAAHVEELALDMLRCYPSATAEMEYRLHTTTPLLVNLRLLKLIPPAEMYRGEKPLTLKSKRFPFRLTHFKWKCSSGYPHGFAFFLEAQNVLEYLDVEVDRNHCDTVISLSDDALPRLRSLRAPLALVQAVLPGRCVLHVAIDQVSSFSEPHSPAFLDALARVESLSLADGCMSLRMKIVTRCSSLALLRLVSKGDDLRLASDFMRDVDIPTIKSSTKLEYLQLSPAGFHRSDHPVARRILSALPKLRYIDVKPERKSICARFHADGTAIVIRFEEPAEWKLW